MGNSRRSFMKAGLLGGATVAASGLTELAAAAEEVESQQPLQILILGGTGFIGPHMVREALRRGHSVTLFNRGRTNSEIFPDLETIKGDRGGEVRRGLPHGWHVVLPSTQEPDASCPRAQYRRAPRSVDGGCRGHPPRRRRARASRTEQQHPHARTALRG